MAVGRPRQQIAWLKDNWERFDGCKLEFSCPQRFFETIRPQIESLPLVTGELQHHAIGCYTVYRPIKVGVRRSEHLLRQAELMQDDSAGGAEAAATDLRPAWRQVVFNHFHDTLGGSCIPSAYEQMHAQLGHALAVADEVIQYGLRERILRLPDDPMQRVVLYNASDRPYAGYAEIAPWLVWRGWSSHLRLVDEKGQAVPCQAITPEPVVNGQVRLVVDVRLEPGQMQVLRIDETGQAVCGRSVMQTDVEQIGNGQVAVNVRDGQMVFGDARLSLPRLDLIEDLTDTWSHRADRYGEVPVTSVAWTAPSVVESGPVMSAIVQTGRLSQSWVMAEYRVYAGEPFVELRLRIHWAEQLKLLKLVMPLDGGASDRRDGVMGGGLARPLDGAERPICDWTMLQREDGQVVAVVAPDVFAVDVLPRRVRFTLLRSPRMVHHEPCVRSDPRDRFSDQGEHDFRFRFYAGGQVTERYLEDQALMLHRPVLSADLTRGMKV